MGRPRAPRLFKGILKGLFVLLIMTINALILWRIFSSGDPASMKKLTVNDSLTQAYAEHGDALVLRHQNQATVTRAENNYGYFSVTRCVFIPEAKQVQLVFRYNNSTLNHLKEDYGLEGTIDRDDTFYDLTLVRTTDLTPDDSDDNLDPEKLSETRFHPSSVTRDSTLLYTYFRYTFEGVELSENDLGVFADVYYLGDLDYGKAPYGALCLYDSEMEWIPDSLTSADRKALKNKS